MNSEPTLQKEQESPLQRSVDEHGQQLEKLGGLLATLRTRLRSVSNTLPENDNADDKSVALTGGSRLVGQVNNQTAGVRLLQKEVEKMLAELEA